MPTIKRLPKKQVKRDNSKHPTKAYNAYKKIRDAYIMEHPLCEMCLKEGKTTPVKEVHHKTPILTGKTELEQIDLATDSNNLMGLCEYHHHQLHNKKRGH